MADYERALPRVLAIDPDDCGCTECLTGEYLPYPQFAARASVGDWVAVLKGDIANNTYRTDEWLKQEAILHIENG